MTGPHDEAPLQRLVAGEWYVTRYCATCERRVYVLDDEANDNAQCKHCRDNGTAVAS